MSVSRQAARAALRVSNGQTFFSSARQQTFRQVNKSSSSSSGRLFFSSKPPKPSSKGNNSSSSSTSTSPTTPLKGAASSIPNAAKQAAAETGGNSSSLLYIGGAALVAAIGGFYLYSQDGSASAKVSTPTQADYQKVYDEIARLLEEKDDYDDGSYGPVLLRLAWHASGTYDKETKTGGSNGATMRFAPESDHGANAGLKAARDFLAPVKAKFPWITYSDLWTLGGACAIQEMQGPSIPWRPGRADSEAAACTPDGRLPDAAKGSPHLRDIFYRMGFDDREIVALSGAHALGRCHTDRSGFEGPWTFSPTVLTNDYYRLLLEEKWNWRKWNGPKQLEDAGSKTLMMLPTDYALIQDKAMKPWVEKYAADNEAWFRDFQGVVVKLFELGVPFKEGTQGMTFKATNA